MWSIQIIRLYAAQLCLTLLLILLLSSSLRETLSFIRYSLCSLYIISSNLYFCSKKRNSYTVCHSTGERTIKIINIFIIIFVIICIAWWIFAQVTYFHKDIYCGTICPVEYDIGILILIVEIYIIITAIIIIILVEHTCNKNKIPEYGKMSMPEF